MHYGADLGHFEHGHSLTPLRAKKLESKLELDPADVSARLTLLGFYYLKTRKPDCAGRFWEHLFWMLRNDPGHEDLHHVLIHFDVSDHTWKVLIALLDEQIQGHPTDLSILKTASALICIKRTRKALAYLEQGEKLEPQNVEWPMQMANLCMSNAFDTKLRPDRQFARLAMKHGLRALQLRQQGYVEPSSYFETMLASFFIELANVAFRFGLLDDANAIGEHLLAKPCAKRVLISRHNAQAILGLVCCLRRDVETAKQHLSEMTQTIDPFLGYDVTLARRLLSVKERTAVTTYLQSAAQKVQEALGALESGCPIDGAPWWVKGAIEHPENFIAFCTKESETARLKMELQELNDWLDQLQQGKRPKLRPSHPREIYPALDVPR